MNKNKFTRGPWNIYEDESPVIMGLREDGENIDIAILPNEFLDQKEIQANAKLIAAVPDLLEAAIAMLDKLYHMTSDEFSKGGEREERIALRAAISKAGIDIEEAFPS